MICEKCRTDMLVDDEFIRGRHIKRKWKCPKCKNIQVRNVSTVFPKRW